MSDDDQHWLDALAGRVTPDGRHHAEYEAFELREAILRHRNAQPSSLPTRDPQREADLIARAQREGLIQPIVLATKARWRRTVFARPAILAYAAAATVACVAVALALILGPTAEIERVRGAADGIVVIEASDPRALKEALLRELRAVGVSATGYELLGVQGIDADLPQPIPAPVRAVLAKHHLDAPADGVLKVEIAPIDTR
jgi:hypothetical protein